METITSEERQGVLSSRFSRRQKIVAALIGIIVVVVIALGWYRAANDAPVETVERKVPVVQVKKMSELRQETSLSYQAVVEPAISAPLVARMGGRVSGIRATLGNRVQSGAVVVQIDAGNEGNPAAAQIAGLNQSLAILKRSEQAALDASTAAITLAQNAAQLAQKSRPLTLEQVNLARQQADVAVRAAELSLQDARDLGVDAAVRAADIAFKNARLVQNQATASRTLAQTSQSISVQQAQLNVQSALAAKTATLAQLDSQKQQIVTQLAVAREQVRMQQVIAPIRGEVTQLNVKVGDFIRPGDTVGEVNGFAGAYVRLDVSSSARNAVEIGMDVSIEAPGQTFTGTVINAATAPASATNAWQVDILITNTKKPIHAGDLVTVTIPVSRTSTATDTPFIPLSIVSVRQEGTTVFTVDDNNIVHAHVITIEDFSGAFAHVDLPFEADTRIVVDGSRTLKEGDTVSVSQ